MELVYQSPEETGRVNRRVDFRSDIYSLVLVLNLSSHVVGSDFLQVPYWAVYL